MQSLEYPKLKLCTAKKSSKSMIKTTYITFEYVTHAPQTLLEDVGFFLHVIVKQMQ